MAADWCDLKVKDINVFRPLAGTHRQASSREALKSRARLTCTPGHLPLLIPAFMLGAGWKAGGSSPSRRLSEELNGPARWTACITDFRRPADGTLHSFYLFPQGTSSSNLNCLWFESRGVFPHPPSPQRNWIPSWHSCSKAAWWLLPTEASFCAAKGKTRPALRT